MRRRIDQGRGERQRYSDLIFHDCVWNISLSWIVC